MKYKFLLKTLLLLIVIGLVLVLYYNFIINSFRREYDEKIVLITDDLGDVFEITRGIYDFPDPDPVITVKHNEKVIFNISQRDDFCNDYQNDVVDNFSKIENEYHFESVHAYLFPWGIIYSLDNKKTFLGVVEADYNKTVSSNLEFSELYNNLIQ